MTPSAHLAATIEILAEILSRPRPAADILKEWGKSHRFAGSSDRSAIATLVYDALRVRNSSAWIMGEDTARAIAIGSLHRTRHLTVDDIDALCSGEKYAPAQLMREEYERLEMPADIASAPAHIQADIPEWLMPSLSKIYDTERLIEEGQALAARAPMDVRVNTLLKTREEVLPLMDYLNPTPTPYAPNGLRLPLDSRGRSPNLKAEPVFAQGFIEPQDEGSQLAAIYADAKPGMRVLDLCAGGGGKTLALAAVMQNEGQIIASDKDGQRLMPIFERLTRAQVRHVDVRPQRRDAPNVLADLAEQCDLVLIDAPCTGTGTWRRHPDTKWRMRPSALEMRIREQAQALEEGWQYVKPGGNLIYITCSLLKEENEDQIEAFLAAHSDAELRPTPAIMPPSLTPFAGPLGLRLSPLTTQTDGFFMVGLRKMA